jgi:signal transduction histidine kinase
MKGLVEAFLALARGKDHHSEKATLDAIVREELPNWKRMAEKKENRLVLQGEEQPSSRREIGYPAVLLRTVIDNLVRNAIHHTSRGEIVLVLKADGFELRDNGSGIAAEEISKVFQPYYRGTESHRHGLGLGLSLVQRICEREQWTVALEQNRPSGCLFKVNLE